jgi:GNAT superfamily N-acetyltransferase
VATVDESQAEVVIEAARPGDAGQILTVQRAAYVTEAQLYGDPFITPLTESLAQVRAAIDGAPVVLVARRGARVIGAARGTVNGHTGQVGRVVVAPDEQGHGVATALLDALEEALAAAGCAEFALFTGHLSDGNLRLYRRRGYAETRREHIGGALTFVHMRKKAAPG